MCDTKFKEFVEGSRVKDGDSLFFEFSEEGTVEKTLFLEESEINSEISDSCSASGLLGMVKFGVKDTKRDILDREVSFGSVFDEACKAFRNHERGKKDWQINIFIWMCWYYTRKKARG